MKIQGKEYRAVPEQQERSCEGCAFEHLYSLCGAVLPIGNSRCQEEPIIYKLVEETDRAFQVGGSHYSKHTIQPFDIIEEYNMDFFEGNALKYLLRWKDKNGIEDLQKAKHYIDELIKRNKQ